MEAKDHAQIRAHLNQLNTEELEELLRTDFESNEESGDEMFFAILEVMEERERSHPTGRLPDVSKAWHEFQTHYNTPEGEGLSLYLTEEQSPVTAPSRKPARPYPLRRVLIAAALVAVLVVVALPPALGYDSFLKMVGVWNSEQFYFQADRLSAPMPEEYAELQAELESLGITGWTVPHHIPDGFQSGEVILYNDPETGEFYYFSIIYQNEDKIITFNAMYSQGMSNTFYEKDDQDVETYTYSTVDHYIFSNAQNITAAWYYNGIEYSLITNLSGSELKEIINSMY